MAAHLKGQGAFGVRMGPPVVTRRWTRRAGQGGHRRRRRTPPRRPAPAERDAAGARVVVPAARARLAAAGGRGRLRGRPAAVHLPGPARRRRRHAPHRGRRPRRDEPAVAAQHQEGRQGRASWSTRRRRATRPQGVPRPLRPHRRARPLHAAAAGLLPDHVRRALRAEDPDRIRSTWPATRATWSPPRSRSGSARHAWYSYGASSTEKREVRGSNAVQWAMIRDALAAGADVYDLRGITDTLDADDPHVGLIQFKVGTGGEAVEYAGEWDLPLNRPLYKAFDALHERGADDEPHPHRRRRPLARATCAPSPTATPAWCRSPRATATASASAGWPAASGCRPWARRRHPRGRHLRRAAARSPAGSTAPAGAHPVAAVRRRARARPATSPAGWSTRSAGSRTCRPARPRARTPGSCSSGSPAMLRHGMTAASCARRPRGSLGGRRGRGLEGVALHLPLAARLAPRRGAPADERRGRPPGSPTATPSGSATSPPTSWRALRASLPRLHLPARASAPTSGSATAARCGSRATVLDVHAVERGDAFGYRGRRRPKAGHIARRQRRHRPRHRPRGADRRPVAARPGPPTLARGGLDAVGFVRSPFSIDGKQRLFAEPPHMQASMLFLPARRARARRSATRSTSGCASPRPTFDRVVARLTVASRRPSRAHRVVPRAAARRAPRSPTR